MTSYMSDPFEGGVNPRTSYGQKIYTLVTADRKKDDLLSISQENVSEIMSDFCHNANDLGWGYLVHDIKAEDNITTL